MILEIFQTLKCNIFDRYFPWPGVHVVDIWPQCAVIAISVCMTHASPLTPFVRVMGQWECGEQESSGPLMANSLSLLDLASKFVLLLLFFFFLKRSIIYVFDMIFAILEKIYVNHILTKFIILTLIYTGCQKGKSVFTRQPSCPSQPTLSQLTSALQC